MSKQEHMSRKTLNLMTYALRIAGIAMISLVVLYLLANMSRKTLNLMTYALRIAGMAMISLVVLYLLAILLAHFLFLCNKALIRQMSGFSPGISCLVYSNDGTKFAVGNVDGELYLADLETSTVRSLQREHSNGITSLEFSFDNRLLASASADGSVVIWDVRLGVPEVSVPGTSTTPINSVRFVPQTYSVLFGGEDGHIRRLDLPSTNAQVITQLDAPVTSLDISWDGKFVVSLCRDSTAVVWNLSKWKEVTRDDSLFRLNHTACLNTVVFSPDGQSLYGIAASDKVVMWDFKTGVKRELSTFITGFPLISIACSPDGKHIAGSILFGGYVVWETDSGRQVSRFHAKGNPALVFSPTERMLATAGKSGEVQFWDIDKLLKCGNRTPFPVN